MGYQISDDRLETHNLIDIFFQGPIRGFDSENKDIEVPPDHVPVLQFADLPNGSPSFVNGYSLLDTTFDMSDNAKPLGYGQLRASSGTDTYVFIQADDTVVRWDASANATVDLFDTGATGFFTSEDWSSVQLMDYLIFTSRNNGCWKWDGSNFLPLGATLISDCESDQDGQWAGETAESTVVMEGAQSYSSGSIAALGNTTLTFTPTTNLNLTTGLNSADAYSKTNASFGFFVRVTDASEFDEAASYIRVTTDGTNYVQENADQWVDKSTGATVSFADNTWVQIEIAISNMTETGTFNLSNVDTVVFYLENDGGAATTVYIDCVYQIYTTQPPAANFCETWKNMLILGDTEDGRSDIAFTKALAPDQFNALAVQPVDSEGGGGNVTGLHRYFNQVFIGKQNTCHSLGGSLSGTVYPNYNLEILDVSTEYGCDSHRAIVEAQGMLWFPWQSQICSYDGTQVKAVPGFYHTETGNFEEQRLAQKTGAYAKTLGRQGQIWWAWPPNGATTNTSLIKYDVDNQGFLGPHSGLTGSNILEIIFVGYESGRETLIGIDTSGDVMNLSDSTVTTADGTNLASIVRFPWSSGGRPEEMKHWNEVYFNFENQSSGALTVQYRLADHPREMSGASFSSISPTLDQTAAGERGKLFIGQTSRWIQLQIIATGVRFDIQWPWHMTATPMGPWT